MPTMTLEEIRLAITKLSPEDRRQLRKSLHPPRFVKPSKEEREEILRDFHSTPKEAWVDWNDLRGEFAQGEK